MAIKNFPKVFDYYIHHPNLKGTFAEIFYTNYKLFEDKDKKFTPLLPQHLLLKYTAPEQICNFNKNVHGGAFATILDTATTMAILKFEKNFRKNVTVNMNVNCIAPASANDDLIIQSIVTKMGKTIAFTECSVFQEKTQQLVMTGSHTKIFLKDPWDPEMIKISQQ